MSDDAAFADKLRKILALTRAENDQEALNALRHAQRLLDSRGARIEELGLRSDPPPAPSASVEASAKFHGGRLSVRVEISAPIPEPAAERGDWIAGVLEASLGSAAEAAGAKVRMEARGDGLSTVVLDRADGTPTAVWTGGRGDAGMIAASLRRGLRLRAAGEG